MADIVGLLPVGGNGTRLGMPFPKPLAPVITNQGIVPVYRLALAEVRVVTDVVYAIVNPRTDPCLLRALDEDGIENLVIDEPSLPGALGKAGDNLSKIHSPDMLVATMLPDSILTLRTGTMRDVVNEVRGDGALALFRAGADQLDYVELDGDYVKSITTKTAGATGSVVGWGAFVIRAGALANFTADELDGPQLGRLDMGWAYLGESVDLGTVERYIEWHDMRESHARRVSAGDEPRSLRKGVGGYVPPSWPSERTGGERQVNR